MEINSIKYNLNQSSPLKTNQNSISTKNNFIIDMYFKSDIQNISKKNTLDFCGNIFNIFKIGNKKESVQSELVSEKLSYKDEKQFQEIYDLDDKSFGYIVHYTDAEEFKNYLSWKNIDTFLVKSKDKQLLGYYQIYMPRNDNLYIETLNLKPEYRGKHTGFTTHIFNEIINIAKQNKAKKISLHVEAKNKTALDLYQRLGFKIIRTEKDFYVSETNPAAYYMEKQL